MQRMFIVGAALLVALAAGTAQAQVATTDFVPAAPNFVHPAGSGVNGATITPDNPAALAWGMPSRIAVGKLKGTLKDNGVPDRDFSGDFVGFRFVGSLLGIAVAEQTVKDDSPVNFGTYDRTVTAQLSLNLGNRLALGIGAGKASQPPTLTSIPRQQIGASLRLGDIWYVGAAFYQDKLEPAPGFSFKRNGTLLGVALRTEGTVRWYVGLDHVDLKDFDVVPASGGIKIDRASVQMLAGWFLLGASTSHVKPTGSNASSVHHAAYDIGFVPMQGLAVSLRIQTTPIFDPGGFVQNGSVDTSSLALSWLF